MTEQEQIAAYIAKRGITRVETGVSALGEMTARDWAKAARNPQRINATSDLIADRIAERHTVIDHLGRVRVRNGLGEWIA